MSIDFRTEPEVEDFDRSMTRVLSGWVPALALAGAPGCDHDEVIAKELAALGWERLWETDEIEPFCVAGASALGRSAAPLSLVDVPTLGGIVAVDGMVRYAPVSRAAVVPSSRGVAGAELPAGLELLSTLDNDGSARFAPAAMTPLELAGRRLRLWSLVTAAYVSGLARASLEIALEHAKARIQFGAPLAALPVVQERLAEAALTCDGLELAAWGALGEDNPTPTVTWAVRAAPSVTAAAHQVTGAVGFTLEMPLHRYHRRAKSVQTWTDAFLTACARPC